VGIASMRSYNGLCTAPPCPCQGPVRQGSRGMYQGATKGCK
jgi:hypothetical protein